MSDRIGDWMQTASGRRFYPLDPRPEEVFIEDIAHALSMICRFGGHCDPFYSVAEHSVRVSVLVGEMGGPHMALAALLHDAAEAYIGDMIRPLKRQPQMAAFGYIETLIANVIDARFGTSQVDAAERIEWADGILLATECRDLCGGQRAGAWWTPQMRPAHPLNERIVPWDPIVARACFIDRFAELGGKP